MYNTWFAVAQIICLSMAVVFICLLTGCQDTGIIVGKVTTPEGTAIADVEVSLYNFRSGKNSTIKTNSVGEYTIDSVPPIETQAVVFEKEGYTTNFLYVAVIKGVSSRLDGVLKKRDTYIVARIEDGAQVGNADASLIIPQGIVVDEDGDPVSGPAEISVTPINVSGDELSVMPGGMLARTADGGTGLLESYGAAEVVLSQDGEQLRLTAEAALTFRAQLPQADCGIAVSPTTWFFDDMLGLWTEVNQNVLNPQGEDYSIPINRGGYWNVDGLYPHLCLEGKVIDACTLKPISGASILAEGTCYNGKDMTSTSSLGDFCVYGKSGSNLNVRVSSYGYEIFEQNIALPDKEADCGMGECLDLGNILLSPIDSICEGEEEGEGEGEGQLQCMIAGVETPYKFSLPNTGIKYFFTIAAYGISSDPAVQVRILLNGEEPTIQNEIAAQCYTLNSTNCLSIHDECYKYVATLNFIDVPPCYFSEMLYQSWEVTPGTEVTIEVTNGEVGQGTNYNYQEVTCDCISIQGQTICSAVLGENHHIILTQ